MSTSQGPSLYMSEHLVESAGAVLFRLSTKEICVLRNRETNGYLLAKGKRNCGETRKQAAIREVAEETGYSCHLIALDMSVTCPPAIELEQQAGGARFYRGICEPIAVQLRPLNETDIKLVSWYVAVVDEDKPAVSRTAFDEDRFEVLFVSYDEAITKLTFEHDRNVTARAISLVKQLKGREDDMDE